MDELVGQYHGAEDVIRSIVDSVIRITTLTSPAEVIEFGREVPL
jgi:hypothetical protein